MLLNPRRPVRVKALPGKTMSYNALNEGSVVLRLEFSIADAVHQRGLFAVLQAAIAAWWSRPRIARVIDLPARLRADVGLPPADGFDQWLQPGDSPQVPPPLWRPGL